MNIVKDLEKRLAAARLAEEVETIRQGFFVGYHFDQGGRCWEHWLVEQPCGDHEEPYTDEYNYGVNFCRCCNTRRGIVKVLRRVRAPQYDAPKPPEVYTP